MYLSMEILAFLICSHPTNFNEHLTVVKDIRDFPSWSVKTSTSGRTSTDPLSFQTSVTSTSISQLSHLINFTLQFKSRSNFTAPVSISIPEATRSLEYFEVSFLLFLPFFISSSLFLILSRGISFEIFSIFFFPEKNTIRLNIPRYSPRYGYLGEVSASNSSNKNFMTKPNETALYKRRL